MKELAVNGLHQQTARLQSHTSLATESAIPANPAIDEAYPDFKQRMDSRDDHPRAETVVPLEVG